ncbi:MAG: zinc-binding dehydrogenase [Elusimicrobia bacterium]|nr:zinc-binding dehydrogenase [Elusimicrobiota bacterium]
MKAAFIQEHGGSDKIQFGEQHSPNPRDHEVQIKVRACALNHLDIWVRNGIPAYPVSMPHILGSDISGEIASIPPSLSAHFESVQLKAGSPVVVAPGISCGQCRECVSGADNVCPTYKIIGAATHGGYAEYVTVPAKNVFPKPEHLSYAEAASFPLVFLTAWHMLVSRAQIKSGDTVLVVGAGSGVGSAGIQIAKSRGGTVIAVSSSEEKLQFSKKVGADYCIHGQKEDFAKTAREITQGRGVDIVFEHVGPATWEKSVRSLAPRGRIVTCGATTGHVVSLDLRPLFTKDFSILGSKLGTLLEFMDVLSLFQQKRFVPVVSKVFPLEQARLAQEYLEKQEQFGKVVLKI